jgi:hypothetical protein
MITDDFYGKNGFIWWVGSVEDINDPLQLGSVRVRIIGVHSDDKTQIPTESLPWAQITLPPTGARDTAGPKVGDWVFGFFQDGEYAQIPVVLGIFPGIHSVQAQTVFNEFVRTTSLPIPVPPSDVAVRTIGEPTTARLSRGVLEGTLVNRTNRQLSHVCDVSNETKSAIGKVKLAVGTIIKKIREFFQALIAKLGLQPSGQFRKIVDKIRKLTEAIREAIDFYEEEIKPIMDAFIQIARYLRAIIDYILSLPARLAAFLSECLRQFTQSILGELTDLVSAGIPGAEGGFGEVLQAAGELADAAGAAAAVAVDVATFPAELVQAFINPASVENVALVEQQVDDFIASNFPTSQETLDDTAYSPAKGI